MLFYYTVLYLAPASIFTTLTVLATRRKARWWVPDFLVLPLPGAVWMLLMNEGLGAKSFSNLIELVILAVVVIGLFIVRGELSSRMPRAVFSLLLLLTGLVSAAALFFLVPPIAD